MCNIILLLLLLLLGSWGGGEGGCKELSVMVRMDARIRPERELYIYGLK